MSSVWVSFELSFLSKHILYEGTTFRHVMHVSSTLYYCTVHCVTEITIAQQPLLPIMEYSFRVRYAYLIQFCTWLNIQLIIPPQGLYALFLPYDHPSSYKILYKYPSQRTSTLAPQTSSFVGHSHQSLRYEVLFGFSE